MTTNAAPVERFTAWCADELFTKGIIDATRIINRFCDLHLQGLYLKLNLPAILAEWKTAAEIVKALGFVESADVTVTAMLNRLADRTGVVMMTESADQPEQFKAVRISTDPPAELESLRQEMAAIGADYTAATEFLDFGAKHFVEALQDDPDFMDKVLSGRDARFLELWNRATNVDPLQDLHGRMGARAITDLFEKGVILEIGGGTGNGIRHFFRTMESVNALGRIDKYIFTDISMPFILGTRKEITEHYPSVPCEWKFVDINKPLDEQKIPMESVDLTYAVNAAHVAKDIVAFLKSCRGVLRKGGSVPFAERVRLKPREMAPRELTLNLSIYHRSAVEKADYRPMHCYLTPDNWIDVLSRAGFRNSLIMPNLVKLTPTFPDQYASVVFAQRS